MILQPNGMLVAVHRTGHEGEEMMPKGMMMDHCTAGHKCSEEMKRVMRSSLMERVQI